MTMKSRSCLIGATVRCMAAALALNLAAIQGVQAVELIKAEEVLQRQAAGAGEAHARLRAVFERGDVAAALAERGVGIEEARARVAALTDAEAAQLLAEIDRAPAGASGELIGTLILVFVILAFSDILGFTSIFPFLRPAR